MDSARTRPRLLLVGNFLSDNGRNRTVIEDLAERFGRAGYGCLAVSQIRNGLLRGAHMLLVSAVRVRGYDLAMIDVFSGRAFLWSEAVARLLTLLRKPHVLVLRGGNLGSVLEQRPGRLRRLLHSASVVVSPSAYLQQLMKEYCDVVLVRNPLDIEPYKFRPRMEVQPRLVWLRAFHSIYCPWIVPEVIARLTTEFPGIGVIMVGPNRGDGSLERTKQIAAASGVTDRVSIVGWAKKTEVPGWLASGDIFLNTTRFESFGVSVMEAAACGLCIVTTNVGELPYLWQDGVDALLVPPDDPAAMAAAVRRILTEPGLAQRLSRNARRKAEQFGWANILPQWESLLSGVLRGYRG